MNEEKKNRNKWHSTNIEYFFFLQIETHINADNTDGAKNRSHADQINLLATSSSSEDESGSVRQRKKNKNN